jgi:anti-anti-sigma regulatory factor
LDYVNCTEEAMTEKLVATIEQRRSGARMVRLAGVLDEQNGLGELTEKVGAGTAIINLSGVERVSSIGARDWVNWLASLEAKGVRPVLIACSPAVVAQLNRIKNFAGKATVKSFQVPYHCAACDREQRLLVHVGDMGAFPHQAPPCACDVCGAAMSFNDESGSYFAFVSQLPRPKPESTVPPNLARGSSSMVTAEHVKRVSRPRLPARGSRDSLSAFQMPEPQRMSEHDITVPRRMPGNEAPYLITIVALLLCTVGVLVYLLILN